MPGCIKRAATGALQTAVLHVEDVLAGSAKLDLKLQLPRPGGANRGDGTLGMHPRFLCFRKQRLRPECTGTHCRACRGLRHSRGESISHHSLVVMAWRAAMGFTRTR